MLGSRISMIVTFFFSAAVVQIDVFFLFIVVRNRSAASG